MEYKNEVVVLLARQLDCSMAEAAGEAGDVDDMQDEGLSPDDAGLFNAL
jgi:hypothetical protein